MSARRPLLVIGVVALCLSLTVGEAGADVFTGDPVDTTGTGLPYPMIPGLPLILDGADGKWNTGDDSVDPSFTGDIDLVVRVGTITSSTIPAPAGAPSGPPLSSIPAGGGSSGSAAEVDFTVMVSDGAANPPYGEVIATGDLDNRGFVVFAFGDLDGDGIIGPTDSDGSADNAVERQEADGFLGRQVGVLTSGRGQGTLGVQVAAPASMGGLLVGLSAGAYTGSDAQVLFTDGTAIFTKWPFFPPLDPSRVVGNGGAPPPDPEVTSKIKFEPERNFLPPPSTSGLVEAFAVPVDGSEATTGQLLVVSGPTVGAALFREIDPATFRATSRVRVRPAPSNDGLSRSLVIPVPLQTMPADGATTVGSVRLLPVDRFGNVSDPDASGLAVELRASGTVRILSPDSDSDPTREIFSLDSAAGASVVLNDVSLSGQGTIDVLVNGRPVSQSMVVVGTAVDSDGDGIPEDGNDSGIVGDFLCVGDDAGVGCDDNCSGMINPTQEDSSAVGVGDCCNGACKEDPLGPSCSECMLPAGAASSELPLRKVRLKVRLSATGKADRMTLRADLDLLPGAVVQADQELVAAEIRQNNTSLYFGGLASLMQDLSSASGKARFKYRDSDGTVDSIVRAELKQRKGDTYRFRLKAKGVGLLQLTGGSVQLDLDLGDDSLRSIFDCTAGGQAVRCRLVEF